MSVPRILMNCVRMHRQGDNALSGNFFHCLRLIEALESVGQIELVVHVDQQTHPYISKVVPAERLYTEGHTVNSIVDMERCIRRAVRQVKPDLYHKPTGQLPLLPTECRSVWGVADLSYRHLPMRRLQRIYKQISYRNSARKAVRIVTVSDSTNREVVEALSVPPEKVQTIHHGTTEFQAEPEPVAEIPPCFVMTFAHHRHKNVEKVIEAVALARSMGPDVGLVVVGSANNREELSLTAAAHRLQQHVHFTGHITDGQLRYLYEHALCLAFLSRHEGFGLPVLEAMGLNCPVISSNAFALPEVTGDGGPIHDCDDHQSVAEEIRRMAEEVAYRQQWVERGAENAQRFSWQRAADETISLYRSLL